MKRSPMTRRRRRRTTGTTDQRARFHRETLMRATGCPVTDDGHHDGNLQAHHVIPQEKLKNWASAHDLDEHDLADLLWDPTNGLAVCRRHHARHTLATRRLPLDVLNLDHLRFAAALDLGYVIDNQYRTTTTTEGDRHVA